MAQEKIGFVGIGLMGQGMAKNIVEKGYSLTVIAHRKREAVDDLVGRGAVEAVSMVDLAKGCTVIFLCLTGSPEVAAAVAALKPGLARGAVIVDCSTSDPTVSVRLAAELAEIGVDFVDAPLGRTPKEAWAGTLD
ncbi:MAG: NAD(P)-binding domain-containing protein, partial [Rhodoferax sp.]|nr:NAD(P)-binding domain-containing protein [Pseudorhodobacter sp.]